MSILAFVLLSALSATFSLPQILSYAMPMTLVQSPNGRAVAYAVNQNGLRSIWVAYAPEYVPREIVAQREDNGTSIGQVAFTRDASRLVYVQGSSADPNESPKQPHAQVWSVSIADGSSKMLGEGSDFAIAPDGLRVAFVQRDQVWTAPIDGSALAQRLFYDLGLDSDLAWSPSRATNSRLFLHERITRLSACIAARVRRWNFSHHQPQTIPSRDGRPTEAASRSRERRVTVGKYPRHLNRFSYLGPSGSHACRTAKARRSGKALMRHARPSPRKAAISI